MILVREKVRKNLKCVPLNIWKYNTSYYGNIFEISSFPLKSKKGKYWQLVKTNTPPPKKLYFFEHFEKNWYYLKGDILPNLH
jgi:hypothetical protein